MGDPEAIRVECHATYWTQRPEDWTEEQWVEAVRLAKEGARGKPVEAILEPYNCIELTIKSVVYEPAVEDTDAWSSGVVG